MMTNKEKNIQRQQLWKERTLAFEASGQSQRAWSQEQNLPEHQLSYWLGKFRSESATSVESKASSSWLEVKPEVQNLPATSGISLRFGSVVLEVQRGFDINVLVDVIRSLNSDPC